ncbi:hypothetical protein [Bacillus sp. JJ1764]
MPYGYAYGYPAPYSAYPGRNGGVWFAVLIVLFILLLIFGAWWWYTSFY